MLSTFFFKVRKTIFWGLWRCCFVITVYHHVSMSSHHGLTDVVTVITQEERVKNEMFHWLGMKQMRQKYLLITWSVLPSAVNEPWNRKKYLHIEFKGHVWDLHAHVCVTHNYYFFKIWTLPCQSPEHNNGSIENLLTWWIFNEHQNR